MTSPNSGSKTGWRGGDRARTESVTTTAHVARFDPESGASWDFTYAAYRSALLVYRPVHRFIAHHMVSKANRRIRRLLALQGSSARGAAVAANPKNRDAWALAMWHLAIEPDVRRRLWSSSPPVYESYKQGSQAVELNTQTLNFEIDVQVGAAQINISQSDWMLSHAAGSSMRSLWARASALAQGMADAADAHWDKSMLEEGGALKLEGRVGVDGTVTFSSKGPAIGAVLQPRPYGNKNQRRQACAAADAERLKRVRECCRGPCLRFSWEHGWRVHDSSEPAKDSTPADVRKMRLFVDGRPAFYSFKTDRGLWCARLRDRPVEAVEDERWKSIDTLRHAADRYDRQFKPASAVGEFPGTTRSELQPHGERATFEV